MTRYTFAADLALDTDGDPAPNHTFTCWSASDGGTVYTDTRANDGMSAAPTMTDGVGLRPTMKGPDGPGDVVVMWCDAGGGYRQPMIAVEVLAALGAGAGLLANAYAGTWASSTAYPMGQLVSFTDPGASGPSIYLSMQASTNRQPGTAPTYWQMLVSSGQSGTGSGGGSVTFGTTAGTAAQGNDSRFGAVPSLAGLPAGAMFAINHGSTESTIRGTSRTDLVCWWSGSVAPVNARPGDRWLKTS